MNRPLPFLVLVALLFTLFHACKKDTPSIPGVPAPMNLELYSGTMTTIDLTGRVWDENGLTIENASVRLGSNTVFTDEYGLFRFEGVSVDDKRAYIHVDADGYFSSGTIIDAKAGMINSADVRLMPKALAGTLPATTGGVVSGDGISLDFPEYAISTEEGTDYTGNVYVSMRSLTQETALAITLMPGDLAAIDDGQESGVLSSYSMITVELEDANGNSLQVKEGMEVGVSFPIPTDAMGSAPEQIALWHFDEQEGIWKEEGQATLVGDHYEGSVSHFSWWNCDLFEDAVYLTVCLDMPDDFNSLTSSGVYANITTAGLMTANGNTSIDGCFSTFVPAGEPLDLAVMNICQNEIQTQVIGPFSPSSEPEVTVEITATPTSIVGTVVDCDGNPMVGNLLLSESTGWGNSNAFDFDEIGPNGEFEINTYLCDDIITTVTLEAQGVNFTIPIGSALTEGQVNDVGELTICEVEQEYFIQDINGSVTTETLNEVFDLNSEKFYFAGWTIVVISNTGTTGEATMLPEGGLGGDGWLSDESHVNYGYWMHSEDFTVNITEHPNGPGGYIEGTIVGEVIDEENDGEILPVAISFRKLVQ